MAVHKYDGLNTKLLFKVLEIYKGFSICQTHLTAVDNTFSPWFSYFFKFCPHSSVTISFVPAF